MNEFPNKKTKNKRTPAFFYKGEIGELLTKGNELFVKGKSEKALEQFKKVIKQSPTCHQAYYSIGLIHEEWGNFIKAYEIFKICLNLKKKDENLLQKLYEYSKDLNKKEETLIFLEKMNNFRKLDEMIGIAQDLNRLDKVEEYTVDKLQQYSNEFLLNLLPKNLKKAITKTLPIFCGSKDTDCEFFEQIVSKLYENDFFDLLVEINSKIKSSDLSTRVKLIFAISEAKSGTQKVQKYVFDGKISSCVDIEDGSLEEKTPNIEQESVNYVKQLGLDWDPECKDLFFILSEYKPEILEFLSQVNDREVQKDALKKLAERADRCESHNDSHKCKLFYYLRSLDLEPGDKQLRMIIYSLYREMGQYEQANKYSELEKISFYGLENEIQLFRRNKDKKTIRFTHDDCNEMRNIYQSTITMRRYHVQGLRQSDYFNTTQSGEFAQYQAHEFDNLQCPESNSQNSDVLQSDLSNNQRNVQERDIPLDGEYSNQQKEELAENQYKAQYEIYKERNEEISTFNNIMSLLLDDFFTNLFIFTSNINTFKTFASRNERKCNPDELMYLSLHGLYPFEWLDVVITNFYTSFQSGNPNSLEILYRSLDATIFRDSDHFFTISFMIIKYSLISNNFDYLNKIIKRLHHQNSTIFNLYHFFLNFFIDYTNNSSFRTIYSNIRKIHFRSYKKFNSIDDNFIFLSTFLPFHIFPETLDKLKKIYDEENVEDKNVDEKPKNTEIPQLDLHENEKTQEIEESKKSVEREKDEKTNQNTSDNSSDSTDFETTITSSEMVKPQKRGKIELNDNEKTLLAIIYFNNAKSRRVSNRNSFLRAGLNIFKSLRKNSSPSTNFNLARAYHHLGVYGLAELYYKQCFNTEYHKIASFNLILIYKKRKAFDLISQIIK